MKIAHWAGTFHTDDLGELHCVWLYSRNNKFNKKEIDTKLTKNTEMNDLI